MSDEKKKDVTVAEVPPLKDLSKKHFNEQITIAQDSIKQAQLQINSFQEQIQQNVGIINYANHILRTFKLPDTPPESEKKKTDLEVK